MTTELKGGGGRSWVGGRGKWVGRSLDPVHKQPIRSFGETKYIVNPKTWATKVPGFGYGKS